MKQLLSLRMKLLRNEIKKYRESVELLTKLNLTVNARDGKQDAGKTLVKSISVTMCMMED